MVIFTGIRTVLRPLSTVDNVSESKLVQNSVSYPTKSNDIAIGSPAQPVRRKRSRLLIVKFGGSSLNTPKKIRRAVESVVREYSHGNRLAIVVSAIGKTTDQLLLLTNSGTGIVDTDRDDILAMGERTSARIFAAALKSHGIQARYFDPVDHDWPIITDDKFQDANPHRSKSIARIQRFLRPVIDHGIVPVIGGFIGRTNDGRISTLGRGGSDTTALLLASALEADQVILVTGADGILTADPHLIKTTKTISKINIEALVGMADAGTKFIHRKALRFKDHKIDVRVISNASGNLESDGTIITGGPFPDFDIKIHNPHQVASITLVGTCLSRNPEFVKKITKITKSNLEAASQNEHSIILYVKQTKRFKQQLTKLHSAVLEENQGVAIAAKPNIALIAVKGIGLEHSPGVIARISETLHINNINIFGLLTISSSVILLVDWNKRKAAARLIKESLSTIMMMENN